MISKTKSSASILHWPLSKRTLAVMLLAVVILCNRQLQGQESDRPVATLDAQGKLDLQARENYRHLLEVMGSRESLDDSLMATLVSPPTVGTRARSRDVSPTVATVASGFTFATSLFQPDAAVSVLDAQSTRGLLLTGKWIVDYAKMIKLSPEYEKTLESYRTAFEIQKQLTTGLEGVIDIKDKKIGVLQEMNGALQRRGDLYKDLSEVNQDSWFEKVLHKIAFPAGLAVGVVVGVVIAK